MFLIYEMWGLFQRKNFSHGSCEQGVRVPFFLKVGGGGLICAYCQDMSNEQVNFWYNLKIMFHLLNPEWMWLCLVRNHITYFWVCGFRIRRNFWAVGTHILHVLILLLLLTFPFSDKRTLFKENHVEITTHRHFSTPLGTFGYN